MKRRAESTDEPSPKRSKQINQEPKVRFTEPVVDDDELIFDTSQDQPEKPQSDEQDEDSGDDMLILRDLPTTFERTERISKKEIEEGNWTAFDLEEELQQGYFDEKSGSYIRRKARDSDDEADGSDEDAWIRQIATERFDPKAKKTLYQPNESSTASKSSVVDDLVLDRLTRKPKRPSKTDDVLDEPSDPKQLLQIIINILKPNETSLIALRRLAPKGSQPNKSDFDLLTNSADELLQAGRAGIYSETREQLSDSLSKSTKKSKKSSTKSINSDNGDGSDQWEYKTTQGIIFGPFSSAQMIEWRNVGYFPEDCGAVVRRVGDSDFKPINQVNFDE